MMIAGAGVFVLVLSTGLGAANMYSMVGNPTLLGGQDHAAFMKRHIVAGFGGFIGGLLIVIGLVLIAMEFLRTLAAA